MKILIIVESQTKAKTITKILANIDGNTYTVMSSLGHICNLDNIKHNKLGIDVDNNYAPVYAQVKDRKPLIKKLQDMAKQCDRVIIASDEDREGEAIGWHLANTLKLDVATTDRIVFHEITKTAILNALKNPQRIDMNMVKAQQARQVLDKLVGYTLCPMLWRNVKSNLSAGRVQSVCLRIVVDKEGDIKKHNAELLYKTIGTFRSDDNPQEIEGTLNKNFKTVGEATAFLRDCQKASFKIDTIKKEHKNQKPPPPFTTSVLQQIAHSKFGLPPKKVMSIAQSLYERGLITYHRTDSITLSKFITDDIEKYVKTTYTDKYHKFRTYKTNSKNAQEAHEAIRPTNIKKLSISGNLSDSSIENRVYQLIWTRTVATQMSAMEYNLYTMNISVSSHPEAFICTTKEEVFDGYMILYNTDGGIHKNKLVAYYKSLNPGTVVTYNKIDSVETHTTPPGRYNEGSLIKKMENIGIGRPSTYANSIDILLTKEYAIRKNEPDKKIKYNTLSISLHCADVECVKKEKNVVGEKNKLFPTEIGLAVIRYLLDKFGDIMDYNFTAQIEDQLDKVASQEKVWYNVVDSYYKPLINAVKESKTASVDTPNLIGSKKPKTSIGINKKTGEEMFAYVAKFGPVIQCGDKIVGLDSNISFDSITEDYATEQCIYPIELGEYEKHMMYLKNGKFGVYVNHNKKNYKLLDEYKTGNIHDTFTFDDGIKCMTELNKNMVKDFGKIQILNGKYGMYIQCSRNKTKKNVPFPKDADVNSTTLDICKDIVDNYTPKPFKPGSKYSKKKK